MKMICYLLEGEFSLLAACGDLTQDESMTPELRSRINKIVGKEIVYILKRFYKARNKNLQQEIMQVLSPLALTPVEPETPKSEDGVIDVDPATVRDVKEDVVQLLHTAAQRLTLGASAPDYPPVAPPDNRSG